MKIHPLAIYCLHIDRLMLQKISLIVVKVKTAWKGFVRI